MKSKLYILICFSAIFAGGCANQGYVKETIQLKHRKADYIISNLEECMDHSGYPVVVTEAIQGNAVLITTIPEGLIVLKKLIKEMDLEPSVLIEAKSIEVSPEGLKELNFEWAIPKKPVKKSP